MADNVWSSVGSTDGNVAGNWSLGWVPKAGDTAKFSAASAINCVFSGAITCDNFLAAATYTGTLDFNGQTITVTGYFSLAAGIAIVDAADAMNGVSIVVGGNFTANWGQRFLAAAGWTLDVTGTSIAHKCVFQHCDSSGGSDTIANYSTNGGNNTSVIFLSPHPSTGRSALTLGV